MSADYPSAARIPSFSLNFDEAVRSIFRDPDWLKKLALGALFSFLSLVIIGTFFIQGYLLTLGERVARAEPRPLPEWDDFGELLRKGCLGIVVSLVYAIPLLVVGVIFGLLFIPLIVVSSGPAANPGALSGVLVLGYCGGLVILFPLALVIGVVVPAAQAQLILHNHDLGAAFRIGEVFGFMRRQRGQYALMTMLVFAATYFLAQVGQCACYVGIFATIFLGQLFQYHLLGQLCWYERLMRGQRPAVP
jgi:Protein of unknown function (DUF4013)